MVMIFCSTAGSISDMRSWYHDPQYGLDSSHSSRSSGCRLKCLIRPQQDSFSSPLMMDASMADTRLSRVPGPMPSISRAISAIWRIHRTNLLSSERRPLLYSGQSVLGSFLFPSGLFLLLARLGLVCLDFPGLLLDGRCGDPPILIPSDIIRAAVRRASGCTD